MAKFTSLGENFYWSVFFLVLYAANSLGQPVIRFGHFSTREGLSQSTVNCMVRDQRGYMWIGTADGLNRYDGYQFSIYRPTGTHQSISHNTILSIAEDQYGNLWIGTANGLNYYDVSQNAFTAFFHDPADSNSLVDNWVTRIYIDPQQRVWVGTLNGLSVYDPLQQQFSRFALPKDDLAIYSFLEDSRGNLWIGTSGGLFRYDNRYRLRASYYHNPNVPGSLSDNFVFKVFEDQRGNIWVGTRTGGLNLLDSDTDTFHHFCHNSTPGSISNDRVRDMAVDALGNLWVATFEGLNRYRYDTRTFEVFRQDLSRPDGLAHFHIWSLYNDPQGILWIGTYAGGVNTYNPLGQRFRHIQPGLELADGKVFGKIGPMVEHQSELWIATEGSGLLAYQPRSQVYRHYILPSDEPPSSKNNIVKSLVKDTNDLLWVGTHDEGLHIFDLSTRQFIRSYRSDPQDTTSLDSDIIEVLHQDAQGFIWVGTHETLYRFDPATERFQRTFYDRLSKQRFQISHVKAIREEQSTLFLGTSRHGLYVYDYERQQSTHHTKQSTQNQLPSDWIRVLFQDSQGDLWIGTNQGVARWDRERGRFAQYGVQNGMADNNICSLEEDRYGYLWIGTLSGISRLDPRQNGILTYNHADGFPINELNYRASLRTADGMLYFGGNNGFAFFDPSGLTGNEYVPQVVLSDLQIFNRSVSVEDNRQILQEPISQSRAITLNHQQNVFTLAFFSTNFISSEENQYAFRLVGLEDDWNYVGHRRTATYTNLAAGDYTFLVKTANNDGVWSQEPTELRITILPPPWKTWWAYSLYAVAIVALLLALRRYWQLKATLEKNLALEQLDHQKSGEIHRAKMEFFTNVSHEFRTPLTLILGPLQSLLQAEKRPGISASNNDQLRLIERNAHRLLRLVNQLLDLQKYEIGNLKLKVAEGNLVKFVREIFLSFSSMAEEKSIAYHFYSEQDTLAAWYDRDQLEKVFLNLLINAFKYTAKGGTIKVSLALAQRERRPFVRVSVQDTGVGIPPNQLEKIFGRFHQGTNVSANQGTGIGLSLAKSVINLHHGTLDVRSQEGEGTIFHVYLPARSDVFSPEEIITDFRDSEDREYYPMKEIQGKQANTLSSSASVSSSPTATVLVVEDNPDVRAYVVSHLSPRYQVLEANDGEQGWQQVENRIPDLVISDIMMPVLDGISLCQRIKQNKLTSHIPVILLTARTSTIHQKEGLGSGADDYITKPFSAEILEIKVNNLIRSRQALQTMYGRAFDLSQMGINVTSADTEFLDRLVSVITDRLGDPKLSVEAIAHEVGFSRSQLHRKLKELTGNTVSELIKSIRLKTASEMLRTRRLPIAEVSDHVGFSSHAYFTKCFKDHFGFTPAEYASKYYQPSGFH
ncbi:MAG: two-component regulator propeller domain-containing protein [Bacteroidota bacterium]